MKISTIRKALIRQTVIISVIATVACACLWYLSSVDEEYDNDINHLRTQANNVANQLAQLSSEYVKANNVIDVYDEIKKKQDNKMLVVSKEALRNAMLGPKNRYLFEDLEVKMDDIKAHEGDKYKKDTVFIEYGNVNISLKAMSDLDVLNLVRELESSFSGIKFTLLKLSMDKELDSANLIAIKDTGFSPIVSGKLVFTLYGMRDTSTTANDLLNDSDNGFPANQNINSRKRIIRLRQP